MSAPTVVVSVNVSDQDGDAIEGATVLARLIGTDVYNNELVAQINQEVLTDAAGLAELDLFPNALGTKGTYYRFIVTHPVTGKKITDVTAVVPNAACNLAQIANNLARDLSMPQHPQAQPAHDNLTAFSSLVGAADRLPYFTGPASLSLAAFTAAGRSLVGAATLVAASALLPGPFLAADGAVGAPAYGFSSASNTGIYRDGSNNINFAIAGALRHQMTGTRYTMASSAGEITINGDVILARDAANVLAQRNGTSAQEFRVYRTYTDASNYERAFIRFAGAGAVEIGHAFAGTGLAKPLKFLTQNTARWNVDSNGHFNAEVGNTYDIGASGFSPRDVYVGRNLTVAGDATLGDASGDALTINAGTWTLGSNVVSTRSTGALAAGTTVIYQSNISFSGDAGGTTVGEAERLTVTVNTPNAMQTVFAMHPILEIQGAGDIATSRMLNAELWLQGSAAYGNASVYLSRFDVSGGGTVMTFDDFVAAMPTISSGTVTNHYGFRAVNLGNANTSIAIAFRAQDITGSTTMRGLWSSLSAGAGKHNLYIDGTAVNYIAGQIQAGDGSLAAPVFSFAGDIDTGFYKEVADSGRLRVSLNGVQHFGFSTGGPRLISTGAVGWASGSDPFGTTDVFLFRDAANVLAQRNGTSAQTFRLYNTFTDASNYERFGIAWGSNIMKIQTEQAGTGAARAMQIGTVGSAALSFYTNNSLRWQFDGAAGHLLAITDNAHDIGASGATRPRTGYFGTSVVAPVASLSAGTTATAPLKVPHGVAPDSPVNGDIWTTTAGLFARINGATVQFATV